MNKKYVIFILTISLFAGVLNSLNIKAIANETSLNHTHKYKTNLDTVDFGPYMRTLQRKIKQNWNPPGVVSSKRVITSFTIDRSGQISKLKITKSSDDKETDNAALYAVKAAAPFKPLPIAFKKKSVDVLFTFDHNIFRDKSQK